MKPTRKYLICTAPIVVSDERGFDVIEPVLIHEIEGCEIKHVQGYGEGWFHIVDRHGSIAFSSSARQVLWCKSEPIAHLTVIQGGMVDV